MRMRQRGFTLVEVSIYGTLLLVVLGMSYAVLAMSLRYYQTLDNQAQLQQAGLVASTSLVDDLSGTAQASVRTEGNGLVFLSARGVGGQVFYDEAGDLLWLKFVCYYRDGQRLMRRERSITPTVTVPATIPTVASFASDGSLPTRLVAADVTGLSVTPGSSVLLGLTLSNTRFGGSLVSVSDRVRLRQ